MGDFNLRDGFLAVKTCPLAIFLLILFCECIFGI